MLTLADRLKWARAASGLSARGLADRAGLASNRHISLIEDGTRDNLELATLRKIASALGVTVGWLADGEEPQPTQEAIKHHVDSVASGSAA